MPSLVLGRRVRLVDGSDPSVEVVGIAGSRSTAGLPSRPREGAFLSIAGIIVGAIRALVTGQPLLAAFSTGTDLPAYLLLPIAVLIVTMMSAWVPARRAASVDPSLVRRND